MPSSARFDSSAASRTLLRATCASQVEPSSVQVTPVIIRSCEPGATPSMRYSPTSPIKPSDVSDAPAAQPAVTNSGTSSACTRSLDCAM